MKKIIAGLVAAWVYGLCSLVQAAELKANHPEKSDPDLIEHGLGGPLPYTQWQKDMYMKELVLGTQF